MRKILAFILIVSFMLPGCAVFQQKDIKDLKSRVSSLERQQSSFESQAVSESPQTYTQAVEVQKVTPAPKPKAVSKMTSKEIQAALDNAGYYYGPIDGKIGKLSTKAIKEFQADHGLKVDGVAGTQTQLLLFEYLSK